jgi:predicted CopG family antitoxin
MPKIEISEDVFKGLQKLARPFVDSPNDVIRRLLEDAEVEIDSSKMTNNPEGYDLTLLVDGDSRVPQTDCKERILKVLWQEYGGRGEKPEVTKSVVRSLMLEKRVSQADFARLRNGTLKIENRIAWARNHLKDEGLVEPPEISGHGIWKLTERGVERASHL